MSSLKLLTIEEIYEAKRIVNSARFDTNLSPEERHELERAFMVLLDLEYKVMTLDIRKIADSLKTDSEALESLIEEMKDSANKLAGVSIAIKKATEIVNALVDFALKAASL